MLVMAENHSRADYYCRWYFHSNKFCPITNLNAIRGYRNTTLHVMELVTEYAEIVHYCNFHNIKVISHTSHD